MDGLEVSAFVLLLVDSLLIAVRKAMFSNIHVEIYKCIFSRNSSRWVVAPSPNLPIPTELKLTSKIYITETRVRYGFSLKSADRVVIYVDPYPNTKVVDWTFNRKPLKNNFSAPYFVYHVYSMDDRPLDFWIELDVSANFGKYL